MLKESTTEISSPASPAAGKGRSGLPDSFEGLKTKRNRGGVKPGTVRGPYNKTGGAAAQPAAAPAVQFTPETVRPIVSLPFNLACARTGFDGFLLAEDEAQVLSVSGAAVLNTWVTIDPKWVAMIMFSISLCSITAEKTLLYHRAVRLAQDETRRRAAAGEVEVNGAKQE